MLHENAARYGISLTEEQVESIYLFTDILIEWNTKINLAGTSDRIRILNELVLDSLIPVPYLPHSGEMIDLGSGAGFPAIIIKILRPDFKVKLIESNGRKISFLKYVIHMLKLTDIVPCYSRIETITETIISGGCDIVTSRAMTSLGKIILLSDPFLKPGSLIVGFLGRKGPAELNKIKKLLFDHHLELKDSYTYRLPQLISERTTVIIQKVKAPAS